MWIIPWDPFLIFFSVWTVINSAWTVIFISCTVNLCEVTVHAQGKKKKKKKRKKWKNTTLDSAENAESKCTLWNNKHCNWSRDLYVSSQTWFLCCFHINHIKQAITRFQTSEACFLNQFLKSNKRVAIENAISLYFFNIMRFARLHYRLNLRLKT